MGALIGLIAGFVATAATAIAGQAMAQSELVTNALIATAADSAKMMMAFLGAIN